MPAAAIKRESRLNVRLKPEIKSRIEKAATISGKTLTEFAIAALVDVADEIIDHERLTTLSDRDRDLFLKMLDHPPAANKALRKAAKTHKRLITE